MFSKISIGQICGFLYLFILITSVLSQFRTGTALNPLDIPGTLSNVAANSKKFRIGIVINLLSHVSIFALVGLLYIAFGSYNRPLALLATLWRVAEGTILTLSEINNFQILSVAQKFVSTTGEKIVVLETLGSNLVLAQNWSLKIAMAFLALGALLYSILFASTGAVPSILGWLGVATGVLAVAGRWLALVSPDDGLIAASFFPYILFEVFFGAWLLLKGGQVGLQ